MKHYVRLCRPRFEVALLEIEAEDDGEAAFQALEQTLPDSAWHLQPRDADAYAPHVELAYSQHTIEANVGDAPEVQAAFIEEIRTLDTTEEIRYLLLHADVGSGEGRVVYEPWFPEAEPGLMEFDLTGDWVRELHAVGEEGLENFEDFASEEARTRDPKEAEAIKSFLGLLEPSARPITDVADPRAYQTEIPELLAHPLTAAEHDDVLACLDRLSMIMEKPQGLTMRAELAAALMAHATSAAYESAAAAGRPDEGSKLFGVFERIILRRSRELYAQGRA